MASDDRRMSIESRVSGWADAWRVVDFERPKLPENLRPLIANNFVLSDLLTELERYKEVIRDHCSIACNRGTTLRTPRLCAQLGKLFSTPEPQTSVLSPPLTWARLVRHAGYPDVDVPDAGLTIGDSVVQLPEEDRKLLLTGRPWQFLEPEPDENDLAEEIESIKTTVVELSDVRKLLHKAAHAIDILDEKLLRRHTQLVSLQNQHYSPRAQVNMSPTNPTIETGIQSASVQDAARESDMELANNSSGQHSQAPSYAPGSPDAVRPSRDMELADKRSPTCPHTPSFKHGPISACTPNTDTIYSPTTTKELTTKEHASPSSIVLYCTAHQKSGLGQPPRELHVQSPTEDEGTGSCKHSTSFLRSLRRMIDDPRNSHLIRWSGKGDSFIIHDRNEFARTLLPTISAHEDFRAFSRLLWYYNFELKKESVNGSSLRRSWRSTPFREYSNPNFRRGDEAGLSRIEVQRKKDKESSVPKPQPSMSDTFPGAGGNLRRDENHHESDNCRSEKACESVRQGPRITYPKRRRLA